ncbi:MAG: hypothetical protein WC523_02420 [Patescibacteria group bacterium]
MKKIALISVYHKDGITEFAKNLNSLGFDILASGRTARHLKTAGVPVTDVASLVGGEAILGHRVVTLSREVHAGLLATRTDIDIAEMEKLGLPYIDLVCVDLYPLQTEIDKPDSTSKTVIEQTDIGGPTLLRSAAKGRRIVVCDPDDRGKVIAWLSNGSPDEAEFVNALAAKAEYIVSEYCLISARYHSQGEYEGLIGKKVISCKYGENGYQSPAALYESANCEDALAISKFKLVAGDSPSYNNLCDIDRLLQTLTHIANTFVINQRKTVFIAIGVKHGNACGAGIDFEDPKIALEKMLNGDPVSLFGGLIMTNFTITKDLANTIITNQLGTKRLLDGIIAPLFCSEAIEILSRKKGKCRLLANPRLFSVNEKSVSEKMDKAPIYRSVRGGFLLQPNYLFILNLSDASVAKHGYNLDEFEEHDLLLAKAICDTSNSNTITLVKNGQLIGNGVGQQSRVRAAKFAIAIALECGHNPEGAVAASDSFFPFVDGPATLLQSGINAIVTTSGSVRDQEVIDFCIENCISLLMTPDISSRGFYNH